MTKVTQEMWAVKNPNGAVYVTKSKPEKQEDGFWVDDEQHEFFIFSHKALPAGNKPERVLVTITPITKKKGKK